MDLEELAARLGNLEAERDANKQKAVEEAFMNKYGDRISNNKDLGLAILNELNRRGVDTSAADEAVEQVLNQLRMELVNLLDTIKDNQNQAINLQDKLDTAMDAINDVQAASGVTPDVGAEQMPEMPQEQMPEMPQEQMPEMSQEQMPEMSQEQMPEMSQEQPAQLPPGVNLSDVRSKLLKRFGKKNSEGYKPSAGILQACGGMS